MSPVFLRAIPQLLVTDIDVSIAFYTEKLGFTVAFCYGEPPFYGQVKRGRARLNLRSVDAPPADLVQRTRDRILSAIIAVDDAGALFREYKATGVDFVQKLRTEPWGARTFIVRDPDGSLILFAGDK
jgi:catechol 2,3-dioxygenase-like lactoylglutathione lyase family enzyme